MLSLRLLLGGLVAAGTQQSLAQPSQLRTESGPVKVETLVDGLRHPWGLAFLPDGRMLVTERAGRLRFVTQEDGAKVSEAIDGVPDVYAHGQGGLLDVALDPDFASNGLVYLSYAEPGQGGASTAVARGALREGRLNDVEVIFSQEPKLDGDKHFGSRLAFAPDGKLFITTGERFQFDPAQDLSNHLGTIVRINANGSVPDDNPFVGNDNAKPEIWSYGHRNVEGAAIHPETGVLWISEMGPRGGDELNIPEAGKNYGWPLVSWGKHYGGRLIPDPPTQPKFAGSVKQWTPVISPSGMSFYTGDLFPRWRGNLLIGGLSSEAIIRLAIEGQKVTEEERLEMGIRIRNVQQGPDGAIYALTDEDGGKILRLTPERQ